MIARHLRVHGLVQGIGYRAALARRAQSLQLRGWVRNRLDGTVEALVVGDAERVDRLIAWARRGPTLARVDDIDVAEAAPEVVQEFMLKAVQKSLPGIAPEASDVATTSGFMVRPTA
jgi:acylphosphatase